MMELSSENPLGHPHTVEERPYYKHK